VILAVKYRLFMFDAKFVTRKTKPYVECDQKAQGGKYNFYFFEFTFFVILNKQLSHVEENRGN